MDWGYWGLYSFAVFTELMLYGWGLCCILYALYYFGRLFIKKSSSKTNDEDEI